MKVVIMAGGKGTRVASVFKNTPKPMIKISGKPVLEHQIETLKKQGLTSIIITVGYLSDVIVQYFGDGSKVSPITNESFGVNIEYFIEKTPIGNAGALVYLKESLKEDFILINGDILFDIDFERFISFHKEHKGKVSLFAHPNNHPYDSGILVTDKNKSVTKWITKEEEHPRYYNNLVNAGIHIVSPKVLDEIPCQSRIDLDRDILRPLAGTRKMFAYKSSEYVKDMGSPERIKQVSFDFKNNLISKCSLRCKQKAIFLDRDGVINKYVGFLNNIDDFEIEDKVPEAIKMINEAGYLAIVITNQPVVARGELTWEQLDCIHKKMETILGAKGAYLNDVYICPHHPESGFAGEISSLKIKCDCRKPKPGLLLKAANDYNIQLSDSWMIGDSERDIKAGKAAGCKTAFIGNKIDVNADIIGENLAEILNKIFL